MNRIDGQGRNKKLREISGKMLWCRECGDNYGKTIEYLEDRKWAEWRCPNCGEYYKVTY